MGEEYDRESMCDRQMRAAGHFPGIQNNIVY